MMNNTINTISVISEVLNTPENEFLKYILSTLLHTLENDPERMNSLISYYLEDVNPFEERVLSNLASNVEDLIELRIALD